MCSSLPPSGNGSSTRRVRVRTLRLRQLQHIILEVGERFYAPHGWQARTIDVSVGKIVAHCMEPHDVVLSKLGAGREKDLEFASAAAALGLVEQSVLLTRLRLVPATADHLGLIAERIATLFK